MFYVDKLALVQTFSVSHGQINCYIYPPAYHSGGRWTFSAAFVVCQFDYQQDNIRTTKRRMMKFGV